jgi:hypothetical protein
LFNGPKRQDCRWRTREGYGSAQLLSRWNGLTAEPLTWRGSAGTKAELSGTFSSAAPAMQALNPVVDWVALYFDCPGDPRPLGE